MTKDLKRTAGLSASDAKVLTDIEQVGWHTVGVFPSANEAQAANRAISVGLNYSFDHPEIILVGLPLKTCMAIVNVIGNAVKSG
jgi:hypothetical protein